MAHRVAAPPRVSVRDAEQHGMLDRDGKVDATLFNLLAHQKDVDAARRRRRRFAKRSCRCRVRSMPRRSPTTFAVYEAGRALTYLPDPLAVEVAARVFDHPNIADSGDHPHSPLPDRRMARGAAVLDRAVRGSVRGARHYRRGDASTPRAAAEGRARARLRLSMMLTKKALPLLGVFDMLTAADQNPPSAIARWTASTGC